MKRLLAFGCLVAGCIGPQDDPSQLRDLRVIGAQMDPPEIMVDPKASFGMDSCVELFSRATGVIGALDGGTLSIDAGVPSFLNPDALRLLALLAGEIKMRWLVLDPKGEGRDIQYELRACAKTDDSECDDKGLFVSLAAGTMKPGEITFKNRLGAQLLVTSLDGGTDGGVDGGAFTARPLIFETLQNDPYKGLGGIRLPVVLKVTAGSEQVYAQKLMVYSCKWFPEMNANQQPFISGLTVDGKDWPQSTDGGATVTLKAGDELKITPNDFSASEENYVVPSFSLKPFPLKESWKFAWHASSGKMKPTSSGGTLFNGETGRPRSIWAPQLDGGTGDSHAYDVDFWVVVRDGRGGESWMTRKAHFVP